MGKKKAILISCFDWYDDRLQYIEKYLRLKGYEVQVLMSDFSHMSKEYVQKNKDVKSVNYIHVPSYKKNISIRRILSHIYFSKRIIKEVKCEKPDLVYSLIPPNFLVKSLTRLKKILHFKLIFDVIDLWPESFPNATGYFPFMLWKNIRNDYINEADKIILECDYYREILKCVEKSKISIFRLVKTPIENVSEKEPFVEDICLGYLGSINSLIDIDRICEVVKKIVQDKTVLVRVIGDGEKKQELIDRLEQSGAVVKYYGKIYDESKINNILGNCHFGLNIYKSNVRIGLTIKSINYFQMGIPILNSVQGDTKKMVDTYKVGINIGNDIDVLNLCKNIDRRACKRLFDKEFSSQNVSSRLTFLDSVI